MKNKLIEGVDFEWETIDKMKFKVFTSAYHLKRGFCCSNSCKNCPYKKAKKD
jgi:hypothetical protein